jgi:hypothetical protein
MCCLIALHYTALFSNPINLRCRNYRIPLCQNRLSFLLEIVRTRVELGKPVVPTEAGLTLCTGQICEHEFYFTTVTAFLRGHI